MEKSFQCDACPKLYATKFGLERHSKAVHAEEEEEGQDKAREGGGETEKKRKPYSCER
jgi:hypothetical protein